MSSSYFQCSDCRLTITYSERSPTEHQPHPVYEANKDTYRTCCYLCFQVVQTALAKPAPRQSLSKQKAELKDILLKAYTLAGGSPKDFNHWCRGLVTIPRACEYIQQHCPAEWASAYKILTGQEWKP